MAEEKHTTHPGYPPSDPSSCMLVDETAEYLDLFEAVAERLGKANSVLCLGMDNDKHAGMDSSAQAFEAHGVDR